MTTKTKPETLDVTFDEIRRQPVSRTICDRCHKGMRSATWIARNEFGRSVFPNWICDKCMTELRAAQPLVAVCEICEIKDNGKEPQIWICGDCARKNQDDADTARAEGIAQGKKLAFAEVRRWNTKNINTPITWLLLESWLDEKKEAQKQEGTA